MTSSPGVRDAAGWRRTVTKIRTLIVDDEPMARERVRSLLCSSPTSMSSGSAPTGRRPSRQSSGSSPTWCSSTCRCRARRFRRARAPRPERMPPVVFIDRLRPVRAARVRGPRARLSAQAVRPPALLQPLDRARDRSSGSAPATSASGCSRWCRISSRQGRSVGPARGEVGRPHLLRPARRDRLDRCGGQLCAPARQRADAPVSRDDERHREAPRLALRAHPPLHIVNADRIKELLPWFDGEHAVVLQNGTRLTLSRGYKGRLQERLGAERVIQIRGNAQCTMHN